MGSNMKKFFIFFILAVLLFFSAGVTQATENPPNIYFFWGVGCPHCAAEKEYFKGDFVKKYPDIKIYSYEVYFSRKNADLLENMAKVLGETVTGVPVTIIGDTFYTGFSPATHPAIFEARIEECLETVCSDVSDASIDRLKLPFLGLVDLKTLSRPVLTVAIAALDGFNPCAMWALVFLISLLLGMKDRKRMWIFGFVFILTSGDFIFSLMTFVSLSAIFFSIPKSAKFSFLLMMS